MRIGSPALALITQRQLGSANAQLATAVERLSTGLRINGAGDEPAGLAISARLTGQLRGHAVAQRNANDGASLLQTAEGALGVMSDGLQRMRELTLQSLNDTLTAEDRAALQGEFDQLRAEVGRIADSTRFNGKGLLDGAAGTLHFQIGEGRGQVLEVGAMDARLSALQGAQLAVTGESLAPSAYAGLTALSVDGVSVSLAGVTSNQGVVDAINAARPGGEVQAELGRTTLNLGTIRTSNDPQTLTINDVAFAIPAGPVGNQAVIDAINASSELRGVKARLKGDDVVLYSSSGLDITAQQTGNLFPLINSSNVPETRVAPVVVTSAAETLTVSGADAATLSLADPAETQTITVEEISLLSRFEANHALVALDGALDQLSGLRASLGAQQARFDNVTALLGVSQESTLTTRSRIRDADLASETAELTKAQILQQAALASVVQANANPRAVLTLLQ